MATRTGYTAAASAEEAVSIAAETGQRGTAAYALVTLARPRPRSAANKPHATIPGKL